MRPGIRATDGSDQHVVVLEEGLPRNAQLLAFQVSGVPGVVTLDNPTSLLRKLRGFALGFLGFLNSSIECFWAQTVVLRGSQELLVKIKHLAGIEIRASLLGDSSAGRSQGLCHARHRGPHVLIDGAESIVAPDCDPEVRQLAVGTPRQLELPSSRRGAPGPGEHAQGQRQVFRGSGQRPFHHDVLYAHRNYAKRRFVAEDAAAMRGGADGAADVTPELQRSKACGKCGCGTPAGTAGRG
mmetsp:Transcript_72156/g.182510  ORF Transcript_72156/g.182510 Transcript_72156/m.182510 type:complete len:240 (+) Transcript_72156:355-1074(+)